ncbi:DNA topoisomerase 2-binding protein 1-A-like [Ctenocephalides felis]|uniref:DNA topoisomerase 2-binding protein 1-A-like n=1 Tax=Ctenocephalides felis TaxID=7515 RepID=UPI000E6E1813|nr:DNA topoisomerase 2-binding protein 1-A-like [Ctenocephalides felis]
MSELSFKFVRQKKYDEKHMMVVAFEQCSIKCNLECEWISEKECTILNQAKLTKTDIFVFDEFAGSAFEYLKGSKALIIGTRCLMQCLSQDKELPPWTNPLYTLAMTGLIVTTSGFTKEQKDKIATYVQWMGGVFENNMQTKTTHLISNNVTSVKYCKAAGLIHIVRHDWIEAIWKESLKDEVMGACPEFIEQSVTTYRLPPFYGLTITSASLSGEDKNNVKKLIEDNGGTYSGKFQTDTTDVLVINKNGIDSAKYNAARTSKKEIVNPDWVKDSVAFGYAVAMDKYRIEVSNASTPTKENAPDLTSNFSMMSAIVMDKQKINSTVNETVNITIQEKMQDITLEKSCAISTLRSEIKPLFNMKDVRNAGLFLDGCGIYAAGFSTEDREFLYKIFNSGGATRYDEPCEKVF